MPNPDYPCTVININSGYARQNFSWLLSRFLRDFEHWKDPIIGRAEAAKIQELRDQGQDPKFQKGHVSFDKDPCVGLRISVYDAVDISGKTSPDWLWYLGVATIVCQHAVAAIPIALYGEWFTMFVTGVGTLLAVSSASLAQWRAEKFGYFRLDGERKDVALTQGNGCHDVIVILGNGHGLDIEWLASPTRRLSNSTRAITFSLAIGFIMLLICSAGWQQHTWFVLGVGILGIIQNITVAGWWRRPQAYGFNIAFRTVFVEWKVMATLAKAEETYPRMGQSLLPIFFPGQLWPREKAFWEYAERRAHAYGTASREYMEALQKGEMPSPPNPWRMPPLRPSSHRPADFHADIPTDGEYSPAKEDIDALTPTKSRDPDFDRTISLDYELPLIGRTFQS